MRKARLACELSGGALGLGSEGAFLPGPFGFGLMDLELVLLADLERDLELIGFAESPAFALHETLTDATGLDTFAARADFPRHGLVLRPDGDGDPRVRKDL